MALGSGSHFVPALVSVQVAECMQPRSLVLLLSVNMNKISSEHLSSADNGEILTPPTSKLQAGVVVAQEVSQPPLPPLGPEVNPHFAIFPVPGPSGVEA